MSTECGSIQTVSAEVHGELDLFLEVVSSTIRRPNIQGVVARLKVACVDFHVSGKRAVVSVDVGNAGQVSPRC